MNDVRGERYGAVAGVLFILLLALAAVLGGAPPVSSDPPDEVRAYLAGHKGALEAGLWLLGLGAVALVWWFGTLWQEMVRTEGGIARLSVISLTGLVLAGPLALASAVVWATAAAYTDEIGEMAPFFYGLGAMLLGAEGFGLGLHLLAANVLAARTRMLPQWLIVLGLLSALAFFVSAVLVASNTDVTGSLGLAAFVLWCAWILCVSHRMWRGKLSGQAEPGR